jgi:hypothetical protein
MSWAALARSRVINYIWFDAALWNFGAWEIAGRVSADCVGVNLRQNPY